MSSKEKIVLERKINRANEHCMGPKNLRRIMRYKILSRRQGWGETLGGEKKTRRE